MKIPRNSWKASSACLCALLVASCAPADPLTNTEKRARIDAMYRNYHDDFPGVEDVSAEVLKARLGMENIVVVDAREPEEREVSYIPGSIGKDEFEARKATLRDREVVVQCTIGYRSGVYAQGLAADGFRVKNLAGSILAWAHEGGALVDAEGQPTKRVHVYGPTWDLLPDGYESVW